MKLRNFQIGFLGFLIGMSIMPVLLRADYGEELRSQIKEIESRYAQKFTIDYFRDMGIIARKADEAELADLTTEIVRSLLLKHMDEYVKIEIKNINVNYTQDRFLAGNQLGELNRFERFYEPTEEFLSTANGQVIEAELVRFRQNALDLLQKSCAEESILAGIQAVRKTGLFTTKHAAEITMMQEITNALDCCLAWKPEIQYQNEQAFENDYEKGTLAQEARLTLQSDRKNYSEANWTGEWIYRFKGREGSGEGVSQATLRYHKGEETASLVISASRVTSAGRMNFPVSLAGEDRTVTIEGNPIYPNAIFVGNVSLPLSGCRMEKKRR